MKKILLLILCLSFLFAFGSCGGDNDTPLVLDNNPIDTPVSHIDTSNSRKVIFKVTSQCADTADIMCIRHAPYKIWFNENITLPFTHTFDAPPGHAVYLFANYAGLNNSCDIDNIDLIVSITVDGVVRDLDSYCGDNDPNTPLECNMPLVASAYL